MSSKYISKLFRRVIGIRMIWFFNYIIPYKTSDILSDIDEIIIKLETHIEIVIWTERQDFVVVCSDPWQYPWSYQFSGICKLFYCQRKGYKDTQGSIQILFILLLFTIKRKIAIISTIRISFWNIWVNSMRVKTETETETDVLERINRCKQRSPISMESHDIVVM